MTQWTKGLTLLEIIVASVIGLVVAAGAMQAFVMAKQVSAKSTGVVEAANLAEQTIERFRDRVACREPGQTLEQTWFDGSCVVDPAALLLVDEPEAIPVGGHSLPSLVGRDYTVSMADCTGDGLTDAGLDDCLQVQTTVEWNPPG